VLTSVLLLVVSTAVASAQRASTASPSQVQRDQAVTEPTPPVETAVPPPETTPAAAPATAPRVTCVANITPKDNTTTLQLIGDILSGNKPAQAQKDIAATMCDNRDLAIVRMEDAVVVNVAGYSAWRAIPGNTTKVLHLFLDGLEMENVTLRYIGQAAATGDDMLWAQVKFQTDDPAETRVAENRELWAQVLRIARRDNRLTVSIGPHGEGQWDTAGAIQLSSHPKLLSWFAGLVIAGLIAVLWWAALRTPLLRDDNGAVRRPYSLAKHQMAVWFLVVVSAFLFVMMTTGAAAATSSTALILIGISGGTGLAAIVIDANKRGAAVSEKRALEAERDAIGYALDDTDIGLKAQLARAAVGAPEATQLAATIQAKVERLNVVTALLSKAPPAPMESQGWLNDLLSDENGISFHRLQVAVWTVVLVGAFVMAVWRTFAMPDFDTTTLGLMGLSSGTYLGFKFPEKPS
jgi:hypothetical protein